MTLTLFLITLFSLGLAGAMSVIAWRAVRNERRRSEARVAALAAELGDISPRIAVPLMYDPPLALQGIDMFATEHEAEAHSRTPIAVLAGGLIVGTVIMFAVLLSTIEKPAPSATSHPPATALHPVQTPQLGSSPGATGATMELIALGHHRDANRLTVEGIVRNPVSGNDVPHLTAVVLLFNGAGTLVATEHAPVDSGDLEPGRDSRFAISAPASDIVRYRVSFRSDQHIVPHLDKRNGL